MQMCLEHGWGIRNRKMFDGILETDSVFRVLETVKQIDGILETDILCLGH
jgi:hypothetical protein